MNILVLVNPRSANGKALKLLPEVKRLLARIPHDFVWQITESVEEMQTGIMGATTNGMDGVFLMGGDGTVHEAFPALADNDLSIGLIPCGRGNDFARNIGLTLDLQDSCNIPLKPIVKEIDLPVVNDIPYGSIASVGFDAAVSRLAKDGKGYFGGTAGYIICVLKALLSFQPFEVELKVDDFQWTGSAMMVAVANGPYYGGGMKIAPDARIDSGKFEVCIVEKIPKLELLKAFPRVFRGTHVTHPKIIIKSGQHVEVKSAEPREIYADGEFIGSIPAICTMKKKIRVMLPYPATEA